MTFGFFKEEELSPSSQVFQDVRLIEAITRAFQMFLNETEIRKSITLLRIICAYEVCFNGSIKKPGQKT